MENSFAKISACVLFYEVISTGIRRKNEHAHLERKKANLDAMVDSQKADWSNPPSLPLRYLSHYELICPVSCNIMCKEII